MRGKYTSPCMFLALLILYFSFPVKSLRMKIVTIAQNGFDESDWWQICDVGIFFLLRIDQEAL